jgi:hypothetical protein
VRTTATVHDTDVLRELDDGRRLAWRTYRDLLRDLHGEEYERVEGEAWQELQRELRRIERRRKTITRNTA